MSEDLYHAVLGATGEEDPTISSTVVTLTIPAVLSTNNAKVGRAVIQCRTADVIFTINGEDPTAADATTGTTLFVGAQLTVYGVEMSQLKLIRASSTDGDIHVRYERKIT